MRPPSATKPRLRSACLLLATLCCAALPCLAAERAAGPVDAGWILARLERPVPSRLADWAEVQAVLSRGDRRLAEVLMAIPPGGLTVRSFFQALEAVGLDKSHYSGAWKSGDPLPWDVVQSGVSESYFSYELKLAARNETGLSCPPDSAGCLSCQACDTSWAFRYGDNANRPIPAAKGGPWRSQDWQPWSHLKREQHTNLSPTVSTIELS